MRRLKVAFFSHHVEIGGGEKNLFYMAKSLGEILDVIVVLNKKGPFLDLLKSNTIPVKVLRFYFSPRKFQFLRPNRLVRVLKTARFLKREKVDIAHPNTFHDYLSLIPASRISGVRLLPFVRGTWEKPDPSVLKKAENLGFQVVTVSEEMVKELRANGINAMVIRMGVIPELFQGREVEEERKKRELGLNHEKKTLCVFSRISQEKGLERIVRAVEILRNSGKKDFEVLIVGSEAFSRDRSYKGYLLSIIEKAGVGNYFHFAGFRFDIPEILAICDAVILPSEKETVGRTAQETMAAGKPLVVANTIELAKYLKDGEDALLFNPKNDEDLAKKMETILERENLAWRIGQRAKERRELYDQRIFNKELISVYERILGL